MRPNGLFDRAKEYAGELCSRMKLLLLGQISKHTFFVPQTDRKKAFTKKRDEKCFGGRVKKQSNNNMDEVSRIKARSC